MWSLILIAIPSAAWACDDTASCAAELSLAARRTARATLDGHHHLDSHLLQAFLRHAQVTGDTVPKAERLCHQLNLADCPLDPETEWFKASTYSVRPTVPWADDDWVLAGTFTHGKELGAVTVDDRTLRWAVASSTIDHQVQLKRPSCALPRAVGTEVWAPRQAKGQRCRAIEVYDLISGEPLRTLPLSRDLHSLPIRIQDAEPWAIVGGLLTVIETDGRIRWSGGTVGTSVWLRDVEAWNPPTQADNGLSIDRTSRSFVLVDGDESMLFRDTAPPLPLPRPCVVSAGSLVCLAADGRSVWQAPLGDLSTKTELHRFTAPQPAGTELVSYGGGCLVQVGDATRISVRRCPSRAGREGGGVHTHQSYVGERVGKPVLTTEDFADHVLFEFKSVVDLDDEGIRRPSNSISIGSLGDLDRVVSVVMWPTLGEERAWVGTATPLDHGIDLDGAWVDIPHATVSLVDDEGAPVAGMPMRYDNPWTHYPWGGVTDRRGQLRVPVGVHVEVKTTAEPIRQAVTEDVALTLADHPAVTEPVGIEGERRWAEQPWGFEGRDQPLPFQDLFTQVVPGLWAHRDGQTLRLVALATADRGAVFDWTDGSPRLRPRRQALVPLEGPPDRGTTGGAGVLGALQESKGAEGIFRGSGLDVDGVGGLIGRRGGPVGSGGLAARDAASSHVSPSADRTDPTPGAPIGRVLRTYDPMVIGPTPPAAVAEVVDDDLAELARCAHAAMAERPDLSGKVVVRFTIGATGSVTASSVRSQTLGSDPVAGCLAERFQAYDFPPVEGGGISVVTVPLHVDPAE